MRVLVAGDRGYIGTVLTPMLLASGHEVVGLDAGWYDGCDFGAQPGVTSRAPATSVTSGRPTSPASTPS